MVVHVEHLAGAVAHLRLQGRLDAAAAPGLRARLDGALAGGATQVLVDLAEVPFIDSTGLGVLVSGLKAARRADGNLRLVAPGPQVRRLMRLTALDRVFTILETV
ncbi:STAS domain-containing protein [Microvirga yunnanensis]|uniref:STAS domain-containing protein n=1 Tax=Microvirga yunnanensis TaxID=2953740 RepID=UPI0021C9BE03|nr:STAS domain-containing protein [Microvirga sp. HBU65207]